MAASRYLAADTVIARLPMFKRVVLGALFIIGSAQATTFTGMVKQIQTEASPAIPGNIRVSIFTGETTSCTGFPGWYSFDLPSVGLASTWVAILLSANAANQQIGILGTGSCDPFDVETVSNIIALP